MNTKNFQESIDEYFDKCANLNIFKTTKDDYKNDEILECYMCLEDFSEFEKDYIQCECGEKICIDCVKYKFKKNSGECPYCKKIWNKEFCKKNYRKHL